MDPPDERIEIGNVDCADLQFCPSSRAKNREFFHSLGRREYYIWSVKIISTVCNCMDFMTWNESLKPEKMRVRIRCHCNQWHLSDFLASTLLQMHLFKTCGAHILKCSCKGALPTKIKFKLEIETVSGFWKPSMIKCSILHDVNYFVLFYLKFIFGLWSILRWWLKLSKATLVHFLGLRTTVKTLVEIKRNWQINHKELKLLWKLFLLY